jgi:hypothetical protein
MKRSYYYIISALPELNLTDKNTGYDLKGFRDFVYEQLTPEDAELLRTLYYTYDIENLVTLIKKSEKPWQPSGNYSATELQSMMALPDTLPLFLQTFILDTRKMWERMGAKALINTATTHFIDWSHTIENDFLRKWLLFDQNLKNLLIWLNSHKFNLNPEDEVLGSHFEADYLRKTKSGDMDLRAWDFQFREALRHYNNPNIALRETIINEMRWHYLDELLEPYPFGIERILTFAIRLQLIGRNLMDTEDIGTLRLTELIDGVMKGNQLPEIVSRT